MIVPVTGVFAAVLGLLLVALSARVVKFRLKFKKGLGVNEDRDFECAVRAQANLVEYAPLAILMLAIAELNGVPSGWVYIIGMGLVIGRILHAWGMVKGRGGTHIGRFLGTVLTWLAILVTAGLLFWNVWDIYGG